MMTNFKELKYYIHTDKCSKNEKSVKESWENGLCLTLIQFLKPKYFKTLVYRVSLECKVKRKRIFPPKTEEFWILDGY